MLYSSSSPTFSLDNFEGPLELLLHLIQKEEIDICLITLKELTAQFRKAFESDPEVEIFSETLALTATLLLVKSQRLLPKDEQVPIGEEEQRMEILESLIEYCRLKEAAKTLAHKEEEQKAHFLRALAPLPREIGTGLEEVGIDHLKGLLFELMKKAEKEPTIIRGEEWEISQKISFLKDQLDRNKKISFNEIFLFNRSRIELIVQFLALLELMKLQEVIVARENDEVYLVKVL